MNMRRITFCCSWKAHQVPEYTHQRDAVSADKRVPMLLLTLADYKASVKHVRCLVGVPSRRDMDVVWMALTYPEGAVTNPHTHINLTKSRGGKSFQSPAQSASNFCKCASVSENIERDLQKLVKKLKLVYKNKLTDVFLVLVLLDHFPDIFPLPLDRHRRSFIMLLIVVALVLLGQRSCVASADNLRQVRV